MKHFHYKQCAFLDKATVWLIGYLTDTAFCPALPLIVFYLTPFSLKQKQRHTCTCFDNWSDKEGGAVEMGMTAESVESFICALITTTSSITNQQSDDKTMWCDNHGYSWVWRWRKTTRKSCV